MLTESEIQKDSATLNNEFIETTKKLSRLPAYPKFCRLMRRLEEITEECYELNYKAQMIKSRGQLRSFAERHTNPHKILQMLAFC